MKTLLLLRHAKSSWDDPSLDDFSRPLSRRGERAAPQVAQYLADNNLVPQSVLCSESLRTRQTWDLMEGVLGPISSVKIDRSLYLASASELMQVLSHVDDAHDTVMLIGHNPGLSELASRLSHEGPERYLKKMRTKYPTAAVAWLVFDIKSWQDLPVAKGALNAFIRPKDLD